MSLRPWFQQLITRFLYGSLALKAQEEAQALHADAVQAAAEGLRSTMAAMDEADQYLKEDQVDPARREIVSTFRVGMMLMSDQVASMIQVPQPDAEKRKERLWGPFDESKTSNPKLPAESSSRQTPELPTPRRNDASASPPSRSTSSSPSTDPPSEPPTKRRRGRPPGSGKRQREARERAEVEEPSADATESRNGSSSS